MGPVLMAQEYSVDFHFWGTKDGLSDRLVNDIFRDKQGLLWICTKNGLNRFDGYTFKVFNKASGHLPFDYLAYAAVDVTGNIWMQGAREHKNNIILFDPLTAKCISLREKTGYKENVQTMFLYNVGDSSLVFGNLVEHFFYTWHPRLGLKKINISLAIRNFICVSDSGTLWAEGPGQILYELGLNGAIRKTKKVPFVTEDIYTYVAGKGIFVKDSITSRVFLISPAMDVVSTDSILPPAVPSFRDYAYHTGVDDIVWRQGKLYHPSKGVIADLLKDGSVDLKNYFRRVFIEPGGRIWMVNDVGVYMLTVKKSKFRRILYDDGKTIFHNSYRNIVIKGQHLYSCNEFSGVRCANLSGDEKSCPRYRLADSTKGYVLMEDPGGRVMGIRARNIFYINDVHGLLLRATHGAPGNLKYWSAMWVNRDSLLLGTNSGLYWYSMKANTCSAFSGYGPYSEMSKGIVTGFLKDNSGQVWIVSNTGLYTYDIHHGITGRYSDNDAGARFLPAREFHHLYQDAGGVYWLGTSSGLIRWERGKGNHRLFTRKQGLSNNNIYAVYEDKHERLWLSSDYGIMKFNKATNETKAYSTVDGITDNEFNRVSHVRDSAGKIYFGSLNGITCFDPEDFPAKENALENPQLALTSFEQFDADSNKIIDRTASLVQRNDIVLQPGDRFFTLSFALLNYTDVIHNTYYWRIEGVDTAWSTTRDPFLRMSGLPYGDHRLHLKAQAGDGSWGGNDLLFVIHVIKPVYLRGWFILLCIVVVISSFTGWFRWRVYRLKKENERLDSIVRSKTIALEETIKDLKVSTQQKDVLMKEIHHRVKNNIQVISSLLKMELANVQDERARRSMEEGISRISSIGLIHQHLYKGEDLTSIEFGDFVSELHKQVAGIYQQRGQSVKFDKIIPNVSLDIDTALPLGLILNEFMTNSYKYTYTVGHDNKMAIELIEQGDAFVLHYRDLGPGLPEGYEQANSGSLGMLIINGLAKQLGGHFTYNRADNTFVVVFRDTLNRRKNA